MVQKEVKLKVLRFTTPVDKEFFCVHAKVNPTTTDCGMVWYSAENVMRRRRLIALLADSR